MEASTASGSLACVLRMVLAVCCDVRLTSGEVLSSSEDSSPEESGTKSEKLSSGLRAI